MKTRSLLLILFLFQFKTNVYAQIKKNDSFKTITVDASEGIVFDKIVDYLLHENFFIESMDKQTGFVKAKVYKKRRRMLSAKIGERRTMTFILRPESNGTNIILTIYAEGHYFGGDVSGRTQYYEDIGIVNDPAVYQNLLKGLQEFIKE